MSVPIPSHSTGGAATRGLRRALPGALAWAVGIAAARPGLAEALLLLGPLVAVPLGLGLASPAGPMGRAPRSWRFAQGIQLPAALCLLTSFALPPGSTAAFLSLPWLAFTLFSAILGLTRLAERGPRPTVELAIDAGLIFLAVGGTWCLFTRWGRPFLGFQEPIVLLTAAHFHFAGFALPILTGLAGRAVGGGRLAVAASLGVITGVPLVAAGITFAASGWRSIELLAAGWLTAAAWLAAVLQLRVAARLEGTLAALFALSSAALLAAMGLAPAYALGMFTGAQWIDIPFMLRFHATVNVLGFALPGLLAWTLAARASRTGEAWLQGVAAPRFQILWTLFGDSASLEEWEGRGFAAETAAGPRPGDARDRHALDAGAERPGEPEPDGPHRRIAAAILAYEIFSPEILTGVVRRIPVEVGDALGARYHFVPGIDLLFASRVTARFDEAQGGVWRTGFTYRTLAGHPETGEETFRVEKDLATGAVRVVIESWSRPGCFLSGLLHRFVRREQLRAGRAAVERLAGLGTSSR